jgi:hypothetical protein
MNYGVIVANDVDGYLLKTSGGAVRSAEAASA